MSKDNNKRTSAYKVIDTLFYPTCRKPRDEVLEAIEDGFAVLKWQGVIEYRNWTDKVIQFQGALLSIGVQKGFPADAG